MVDRNKSKQKDAFYESYFDQHGDGKQKDDCNKNKRTINCIYDVQAMPETNNLNNSINKISNKSRLNDSNISINTTRSNNTNRCAQATNKTTKNKMRNKIEDFVYYYFFIENKEKILSVTRRKIL